MLFPTPQRRWAAPGLLAAATTSLLFFVAPATASLQTNGGSSITAAQQHLEQQRYLLEHQHQFRPLSCNRNLQPCQKWTERFGHAMIFSERVVIPCGECVTMDHQSGTTIEFQDGLDIQGKLLFAPSSADSSSSSSTLTVRSTLIVVQGVLEILADKRIVTDKPLIEFVLFNNNGRRDHYFTAHKENGSFCTLVEGCLAGRKSITVAGGQLKIHGVPPDTPSWLPLHDVVMNGGGNTTDTIVLDASVKGKWGPKAELLITSHTMAWDQHQTTRIRAISDHPTDRSKVLVRLETPITRPTTQLDDERFAVEVALLSKNIRWRGEADNPGNANSELEGGHFWIFHTPNVQQVVEGVDLINFGQQGVLARYPIHFHLCGNAKGSRVSKNTIRHSNQRCVVVHATDNLLVEENVAYDTKGHCFLLEDGIEVGNRFVRNLGAQTDSPKRVIPNNGSNGRETDRIRPSTFWITNTMNEFEGNVAAGSKSVGFWFELMLRGPLKDQWTGPKPKQNTLALFKDNVAHSNSGGIRTYPTGYAPTETAIFEGSRLYRNNNAAFFHLSTNYIVQGGVFADNKLGLDIDRADNIRVSGTEFIGVSDSFRSLVESQGVQAACAEAGPNGIVTGIELHTWKNGITSKDTTFRGVSFAGYGESLCGSSYPVRFDDHTKSGLFDYFTAMERIKIQDNSNSFVHFCPPMYSKDINNLYVSDLDGSMRPKGYGEPQVVATLSTTQQEEVSTLVGRDSSGLSFLDPNACIDVPHHCYKYCEGICFQTVRFDVDAGTRSEGLRLRVCSRDNRGTCVMIDGHRRSAPKNDNHRSTRPQMYGVHLPVGEYSAVFVDKMGKETWPNFVKETYEESECRRPLGEGYMDLKVPKVPVGECAELIRNGMVEVDETSSDPVWPWLHRRGLLGPGIGEGIGGSDALKSNLDLKQNPTIVQFLDTRCISLLQGRTLEFRASIKLVDGSGNDVACDPDSENCPGIGYAVDERYVQVAEMGAQVDRYGYQLATGRVTVGDDMIDASEVSFFARSNYNKKMYMLVDNVSVTTV